MSGVLHPVGPEPERTYWVRRAVVALVLVALISLIAVVVNALRGGGTPTAVPAPDSSSPAASAPAASTSPTPTLPPSPSPAATGPASPSASAAPPSASVVPSAGASASARAAAACAPAQLRPTLQGPQRLAAGKPATFTLSFINGSKATCTLSFDRRSYELKIFSGTDRIWSTNDCSTAVKPVRVLLLPEKAYAFRLGWNGLRSKDDCKSRKSRPAPGTYFVTSQLEGASPVQLRMALTKA